MSYADLFIDQGADFSIIITLKNPDGTTINVAGYTFKSLLRTSYYTANATANITVAATDNANGIVTMSMNADTSANVTAGRYVYDVKMVSSANVTSRALEGFITVTPQATQ